MDKKAIQILDAANKILSKHGYAGTTVSRVAAEAEVSRGLLHYYFKNKEEMLASVLKMNMTMSVKKFSELIGDAESVETLAREMTEAYREMIRMNPDYFKLFYEGVAASKESQAIREIMNVMYDKFRNVILDKLGQWQTSGKVKDSSSVEGKAALITGIFDGMGIQFLTVPDTIENENIWREIEYGLINILNG